MLIKGQDFLNVHFLSRTCCTVTHGQESREENCAKPLAAMHCIETEGKRKKPELVGMPMSEPYHK